MPLAGRPGCATLLEEKKRPSTQPCNLVCEGLLLKHNVRNENNERYVDYEYYKDNKCFT